MLPRNTATPGGSPPTPFYRFATGHAGGVTFDEPVGNSILHSGQVQVTRRFRNNFSGSLSYTLSKSIDDSSTLGGTEVQNPYDILAERALSNNDHRHTFQANYTWQSPVDGRNGLLANHGPLTKALKDWTFSGTIQAQTGRPFTAQVLGNLSDIGGTGTIGSGRAGGTGLPRTARSGYFNVAGL